MIVCSHCLRHAQLERARARAAPPGPGVLTAPGRGSPPPRLRLWCPALLRPGLPSSSKEAATHHGWRAGLSLDYHFQVTMNSGTSWNIWNLDEQKEKELESPEILPLSDNHPPQTPLIFS